MRKAVASQGMETGAAGMTGAAGAAAGGAAFLPMAIFASRPLIPMVEGVRSEVGGACGGARGEEEVGIGGGGGGVDKRRVWVRFA